MSEFKMHTNLVFVDTFREFVDHEALGPEDFILTNEFLYQKYIQPLHLPCGSAFLESYAKGEPTTAMVDALRADLPKGLKRMIAIGGGAVMDTAKMLSLHTSADKTEALFDLSPMRRNLPCNLMSTPCPPPAALAAKSPTPARWSWNPCTQNGV